MMKATILVIEDSEAINNLICLNLEAAGYRPLPFWDGNEAGVFLDEACRRAKLSPALAGSGACKEQPEISQISRPCASPARGEGHFAGQDGETVIPDLALVDIMLPGRDGFSSGRSGTPPPFCWSLCF